MQQIKYLMPADHIVSTPTYCAPSAHLSALLHVCQVWIPQACPRLKIPAKKGGAALPACSRIPNGDSKTVQVSHMCGLI